MLEDQEFDTKPIYIGIDDQFFMPMGEEASETTLDLCRIYPKINFAMFKFCVFLTDKVYIKPVAKIVEITGWRVEMGYKVSGGPESEKHAEVMRWYRQMNHVFCPSFAARHALFSVFPILDRKALMIALAHFAEPENPYTEAEFTEMASHV